MAAADRLLGQSGEVRKLKLGESFSRNGTKNFHTFRYDFKPASMDTKKAATVDIGPNNQATVTVPHVEAGAGTAHTVFKGSRKPYTKECVLIIDHVTGEIVLEKLHSNVQLKKTRTEGTGRRAAAAGAVAGPPLSQQQQQQPRPHTPVPDQQLPTSSGPSSSSNITKRVSPPMKPSLSPPMQQRKTPSPCSQTNMSSLSVPQAPPLATNSKLSASFVPSMPLLLGGDLAEASDATSEVGFLSDSSNESSSSGSSSGSSSESSDDETKDDQHKARKNLAAPFQAAPPTISQQSSSNSFPSMPHFSQLTEDLHLSESGSDSDG